MVSDFCDEKFAHHLFRVNGEPFGTTLPASD